MHKNAGRRKGFGRQWWRRRLQLEHELRTRLLALLSALAALIKTVSRHKKLITANNFRIKTFQFSFFSLVSRISLFLVVVVVFLLVPFLVAYSHCRFFFAAKKKEELLLLRSRLRRTSLARGAFCFSHSCCCSYSCCCCCCYLKRLRVGAARHGASSMQMVCFVVCLIACLCFCFLLLFLFCDRSARLLLPPWSILCHGACLFSITTCCCCCCCCRRRRALNSATTEPDQPKY